MCIRDRGKGDAADRISCKQFRKFFGIVHHVQFRTSHQCDLAVNEIPVKVSIGISAAVCRDQQIGIFKIRSLDRRQFDPVSYTHLDVYKRQVRK